MSEFSSTLVNEDISLVRRIPKADLHNHCLLGVRLERIRDLSGLEVPPFQYHGNGIRDINDWVAKHYIPVMRLPGLFPKIVEASFQQAVDDGVTLLEMSMDVGFGHLYEITPEQVVETVQQAHLNVAPDIDFRPCLGFSRRQPVRQLLRFFEPYMELEYFTAIDLYDDEESQPVKNFREIFRFARQQGYRCTAHAGEFGSAEDVMETIEELEPDAIQHGIAAADSPEVMKMIAERSIPLNICPTSNIVLQRVGSYATHPARILFDHGVKITVSTDDVTLFDQGVSEEYMHLFRAGLFSAGELEEIRRQALGL